MSEIADLQDKYLSFFGEHAPIFGYPEKELLLKFDEKIL